MTLRQSETLLRALVALALGIGFVGFATHARGAHDATTQVSSEVSSLEQAEAATPIADAAHHGSI